MTVIRLILLSSLWLILPSRGGMTLSWAHGRGRKALALFSSWILPEDWARPSWAARGMTQQAQALPFPNWLPHLKPLLCLGKSRWSCGQLAKLPSKYKRKEREEEQDLPEATKSKNGAA